MGLLTCDSLIEKICEVLRGTAQTSLRMAASIVELEKAIALAKDVSKHCKRMECTCGTGHAMLDSMFARVCVGVHVRGFRSWALLRKPAWERPGPNSSSSIVPSSVQICCTSKGGSFKNFKAEPGA